MNKTTLFLIVALAALALGIGACREHAEPSMTATSSEDSDPWSELSDPEWCFDEGVECGFFAGHWCGTCSDDQPQCPVGQCIPRPGEETPDPNDPDDPTTTDLCKLYKMECGFVGTQHCGACEKEDELCDVGLCKDVGTEIPLPPPEVNPCTEYNLMCGIVGTHDCGDCPADMPYCEPTTYQCEQLPPNTSEEVLAKLESLCEDYNLQCGVVGLDDCGVCTDPAKPYCGTDYLCHPDPYKSCTPDCTGSECGYDGCGGSCGTCTYGHTCTDGQCVCVPTCTGKNCGSDGCGGSCGTCANDEHCVGGLCVCEPDCTGKNCGSDGCGGTCGTCPAGYNCQTGVCSKDPCAPDCAGKQCGGDGCGGSCGSCPPGASCVGGLCTSCQSDCSGKQCGSDGCGGSCGTCSAGNTCQAGTCVEGPCTPSCSGKECGSNGCGGSCGNCAANETCQNGQCTGEVCAPNCSGKECGDDGCGETCGTCTGDALCAPSGLCLAPVKLCFALIGEVIDYTNADFGDDPSTLDTFPVSGAPSQPSTCLTWNPGELDANGRVRIVVKADSHSHPDGFVFGFGYPDPAHYVSAAGKVAQGQYPPTPPLVGACDPAKSGATYFVAPGNAVVVTGGCPAD
jgi:hypothetical protein